MGHLVADGRLSRQGDRIVAGAALDGPDVEACLADLAAACDGIEPFVEYVARCCEQLTAVVSGRESALNTLFPGGSYETVDFNYGSWAVPRYFNAVVRAAVEGAVAARAGGRLRILEIGAGTGGTTAAVLPALPTEGVSYTFSDVSPFFLTRAAERFAEHRFVRYAELDIERSPADQGHGAGTYDVVIAANVLHATRDLDRTLANVRELLAPGGVLVALESTTHPRWFDVTTGLIEGWQRFDDGWRTDVPLIAARTWRLALEAGGFSAVAIEPGDDAPTAHLLQHVLIARAAGDEAIAVRPPDEDAAAPADAATVAVLADLDGRALLADALADERHGVLVDIVRRVVAHVLRADPGRLGRDEPLGDLGFDSLMAVELRNVLGRSLVLARKLPATLVFDHPTIAAIATYLERMLAAEDAGAVTEVGVPEVPAVPAAGSDHLDAGDVAELTDDEAEAMLLRKLAEIEP